MGDFKKTQGGFNKYERAFIYLLSDFGMSKIKIGITGQDDVMRRVKQIQDDVNFKVIHLHSFLFEFGHLANQIEQKALRASKRINLKSKSGKRLTEWVEYDVNIFEFITSTHQLIGDFKSTKKDDEK